MPHTGDCRRPLRRGARVLGLCGVVGLDHFVEPAEYLSRRRIIGLARLSRVIRFLRNRHEAARETKAQDGATGDQAG